MTAVKIMIVFMDLCVCVCVCRYFNQDYFKERLFSIKLYNTGWNQAGGCLTYKPVSVHNSSFSLEALRPLCLPLGGDVRLQPEVMSVAKFGGRSEL